MTPTIAIARRRPSARRARPTCDVLEDRALLSLAEAPPPLPSRPPAPVIAPVPAIESALPPVAPIAPPAAPAPSASPISSWMPAAVSGLSVVPAVSTTSSTGTGTSSTGTTTTTTTPTGTTILTLDLKPLDVNLLGLTLQTSEITVTVTAQPGSGALLGNLLSDVGGLLNLAGVNNALNTVLANVVTLANEASMTVSGVGSGALSGSSSTPVTTTPVLDLHVAPVDLDLLGAVVTTSPIDVTLTATTGPGEVLGNVVTDLANLFNTPPRGNQLNLPYITQQLGNLLNELNAQVPGIPAAPTTTTTTTSTGTTSSGTTQVLSLNVPPIDLNLLGLVLTTQQITVNADAATGNGELLGNLLTDLLNTAGATPTQLSGLNNELNAVLAKVVGILNATTLTLPTNALSSLSSTLQELALPNLVNTSGTTATAPVLNLDIAAPAGSTTPPVDVDLLGLVVTTSNIEAQLVAQTGTGQVLGNLVYNVAHLLDPGGSLDLMSILNTLGV